MRAFVVVVLVAVIAISAVGMLTGRTATPGDIIRSLASNPDVGKKFGDPNQGRFDATVFLFTVILITPVLAVLAAVVMIVTVILVEGTVMQVGRRLGFPDGLSMAVVVMAMVGFAYTQAEIWIPRSLRILGLLARAYLVSTT